MSEYSFEITPKGIQQSKKTLSEHLAILKNDISRVIYISFSEIRARIFDKALGVLWLLLETIITAGLYYLLTVVIFKSSQDQHHFLFILVSVVFWRWFQKTVDSSPAAITSYGSILKQTNFPVYLVVSVFVITEFALLIFGFFVLMAFLSFYKIFPSPSYLYLPFVIITQFSFTLALTLVFSVIGTFFKDLTSLLYAFTSVWWYMSPGIYPVSKIPPQYLWLYKLNPFAHILPSYRDILISGQTPQAMIPLMIIFLISLALCFLGFKFLDKAKYYFFIYL